MASPEGASLTVGGSQATISYTGGVDNNDVVLKFDNTLPTVSSINRTDSNPTNAASVDFTVTFSEPVFNVDAGDFVIDGTGVAGFTWHLSDQCQRQWHDIAQ